MTRFSNLLLTKCLRLATLTHMPSALCKHAERQVVISFAKNALMTLRQAAERKKGITQSHTPSISYQQAF